MFYYWYPHAKRMTAFGTDDSFLEMSGLHGGYTVSTMYFVIPYRSAMKLYFPGLRSYINGKEACAVKSLRHYSPWRCE